MKDKSNIGKMMLLELLLFIGWCAAVVLLTNFALCGFNFWFAFGATIFSFVVACISFITIKMNVNHNLTEAAGIPVILTDIYLIGSIVFNGIFIFGLYVFFSKLLVICNIMWCIVFVAMRIFTGNYTDRLDKQTSYASQNLANVSSIASTLALLLGNDMEPDVRKKILKLKENVDYSNNITNGQNAGFQNKFLSVLNQIESLIKGNASEEDIIKAIDEAENIWKSRNGIS